MPPLAPVSIVIPTLNAGERLTATLAALAAAASGGLVREVIISDGGSTDTTVEVSEGAGAIVVRGAPGRGGQLKRGAEKARGDWLLFLHADTVLAGEWQANARALIASGDERAGVFTLKLDAKGWAPSLIASGAMVRTRLFASPYGDQGLLISRQLYDAIGGYRPLPLFEDVDLIDRLVAAGGRKAVVVLRSPAITSADRYRRDGYFGRVMKNACCLAMYRAGAPPAKIAAFYQ
jgi:rSAM/selenodomain-associated transferase 2